MRQVFNIPKDLWGHRPWHRARLDLQGFVKQNRDGMNPAEVDFARWLYGSFEMAEHHTPPWSANSPAYVESIYTFIINQMTELERHDAKIRELYTAGLTTPEAIQDGLAQAEYRPLVIEYINSVIRTIKTEQRKAA